jgi:membrane fusion protein, heavy metal efflux system
MNDPMPASNELLPASKEIPVDSRSPLSPAKPAPPPQSAASGESSHRGKPPLRFSPTQVVKLAAVLLVVAGLVCFFVVWLPELNAAHVEKTVAEDEPLSVKVVPGRPHTLDVPEDVRVALGIRKGNVDRFVEARVPTEKQELVLPGSTALDPGALARIRVRFTPAEVVKIGRIPDATNSTPGESTRELGPGDWVKKGTELAVFQSVDVGSKKNDLIDAIIQLHLDEEILDGALKNPGVVPPIFILNARRAVEGDYNAINRARDTLRTWGVAEEDVQAVEKEAERLSKLSPKRDRSKERDEKWGQVVLKAPRDGTIIERNVTQKETVVDPTINLFQIADVDRMQVLINATEDDLQALLALPASRRRWIIRTVGADPRDGLSGTIQEIGYIIDVNQRSAVLKGYIDNPKVNDRPESSNERVLRAGQFVTATVELDPPPDVVEIPTSALIDDGRQAVVFVQRDPTKPEYTLRRVEVLRRLEKKVYVRSRLSAEAMKLTRQEKELGLLPREPLRPGDRLLTAGILELKKELEDREANDTDSN